MVGEVGILCAVTFDIVFKVQGSRFLFLHTPYKQINLHNEYQFKVGRMEPLGNLRYDQQLDISSIKRLPLPQMGY